MKVIFLILWLAVVAGGATLSTWLKVKLGVEVSGARWDKIACAAVDNLFAIVLCLLLVDYIL